MKVGFGFLPFAGQTAAMAERLESLGFDSLSVADSPNLASEVFGQLMVAARATTDIELCTGVTNSVTRNSAVVASAMAAIQVESQGRAVCGIGRGDSAVYKLGLKPDRLEPFGRYVDDVRAYLQGLQITPTEGNRAALEWLPKGYSSVPVEVVASGPKMIELAAARADRIALGVGAAPDFVAQKLSEVKAALQARGRPLSDVSVGAYITCVVAPTNEEALDLVRPIAATFVNFLGMKGQRSEQLKRSLPPDVAAAAELVGDNYKYGSEPGRDASKYVPDSLIRWFSAAGTPKSVAKRLIALGRTGLDYVQIVSRFHALPKAKADWHLRALGEEVLPAMREGLFLTPGAGGAPKDAPAGGHGSKETDGHYLS